MFTVGMTPAGNAFFATSTMLVGVPTGIKIFNWLGTIWGGKIRFKVPMLFCLGFLFQFLIAGLTGIHLAVAPFDWQLSDTYFVVAHFHYVLIGGLLFTIFAAIYYWFPKATGRMLSETLGKWHFWLLLIGFHITFDTLHFAGLMGMPRRIYTYQPGRGLETINLIASCGVIFQAAGVLCFVINVLRSLRSGEPAGDDPWDAWTLEWSTTLAAAGIQLRDPAGGPQPPAPVGSEAPGRSGLGVRMSATRVETRNDIRDPKQARNSNFKCTKPCNPFQSCEPRASNLFRISDCEFQNRELVP